VIGSLLLAVALRFKLFHHPACHYSFVYRATWRVTAVGPCAVQLRPRNYDALLRENDVDVYTTVIDSGIGTFEEAAETAGFEFLSDPNEAFDPHNEHIGSWILLGRASTVDDGTPVTAGAYRGMKGNAPTGCYHEGGGGYAGLCDFPVGFVMDRKRWVSVTGAPQTHFDELLNSICIE
jgi:hypothetical protein